MRYDLEPLLNRPVPGWRDNGKGFDVNDGNGRKVVRLEEMRRRGVSAEDLEKIVRQCMLEVFDFALSNLYPDMPPFDPGFTVKYTE